MVTVIITTHGGDLRLSRAINSVLNQSYKDIQLIIVDDNNPATKSRESTEDQLRFFDKEKRLEYIKHNRNRNASAARNTGINAAKGKYICFLDDDDYFLSDHIAESVKCCEENNSCVGVACNVAIITAGMLSDIYLADEGTMSLERVIKTHNIGTGSNLFIRADVVKTIKGFDENFTRNQDIEFIIRILVVGTIICQDRISIVKDISSSRKLDYYKLKDSYNRFDQKFINVLSGFSKEFQKEYYAERAHSLLATAKVSGSEDTYDEAIRVVDEIDALTKKEMNDLRHKKVMLFMRRIINFFRYGRRINIFNVIMKIRNVVPHMRYKKQLGLQKCREIYGIYKNY